MAVTCRVCFGIIVSCKKHKSILLNSNFLLLLLAWVVYRMRACIQKYVILLEEEVIPMTDLLFYLSQCLPVLEFDETLIGATSWNENGQFSTHPTGTPHCSTISVMAYCIKKFCNLIWYTNDTSKIFMLLFNIIAINSNTYEWHIYQKVVDASHVEFCRHAVHIQVSTQWPVWSHCHPGTSSDDKIGRSHWVPCLASRVAVTAIPVQYPLLYIACTTRTRFRDNDKRQQASESYLESM